MIRSFIALALLYVSAFSVAQETSVKPSQAFRLFAANVLAPSSTGWNVHVKSEVGIAFVRKNAFQDDTAYTSFFEFPPPYDKLNFLATAKKTMEAAILPFSEGLINPIYTYTEERKYPCVRVRFSFISNSQQGDLSSVELKDKPTYQSNVLICRIPLYKNTGLMAGFSYMSETPDVKYERAAESFISGVQFSAK